MTEVGEIVRKNLGFGKVTEVIGKANIERIPPAMYDWSVGKNGMSYYAMAAKASYEMHKNSNGEFFSNYRYEEVVKN